MNSSSPHGLVIHRASRTDALARQLARVLADPLPDPFATEIVSVPTPGVERWLGQTLATHLGASGRSDGICAGVEFPRLDRLILRVVEQCIDTDPATDPWHPDRGVWSVLQVLDANLDEPWLASLRIHLVPGATSRRYVTARRVLELFRSYAAQRPEMLERWRTGAAVDPTGNPLPKDAHWQAALWAALCAEIGGLDPVQRIRHTAAVLTDDPARADMPARLSVFGPTRLTADQGIVLEALGRFRRVHLWLPHPSAALWQRVAESGAGRGRRSGDPTALVPQHRLNRRLARDARELQLCLTGLAAEEPEPASEQDREHPTRTLLGRLQQAIGDDLAKPPAGPVDPSDDSIRLHACHGPDRQVEVLREVVLGLLTDHPDLELRDIVVMCPDVETFAPLVSACFALEGLPEGETHPGQLLRVRLADRSLREVNPLLSTLQALLDLGESRAGRSTVLDLCAQPPIARRFGFTEAELDRLHELVSSAGVRWGMDLEHRARFAMGGFGHNTWQAGLERLLLGVALDDRATNVRGPVLPLAEVESSDVDLVGRLVELLHRLDRIVQSFHGPRTLTEWMAACREALALVTEVAPGNSWQVNHAWSELTGIARSAPTEDVLLSPGDIRALLANAFAGRPSRANFRTGALTLCTMTPMRSVPHRVVILLGLDDRVFPRRTHLDGDDLLALDPWIGDRDPRSEDRQILLDAVLAATEHLVVIHSGADPQTGGTRPPAVPVAELRGAIEELCADDPWPVVEVRHPLQPFSPRNFYPTPVSFDEHARRAAQAQLEAERAPVRSGPGAARSLVLLPPSQLAADSVRVELTELLDFFRNPARFLLRTRAQLYVTEREQTLPDEIPIALKGLDEWAVGERMLEQHLNEVALADIRDAELRRGEVPPHQRGLDLLQLAAHRVLEIRRAAEPWLDLPPSSRWINAELGKWQLTGMVSGLRDRTVLRVSYSKLSGRQRLASWLELLALKVSYPDVEWRAVTIGRSGVGTMLGPIPVADARAQLNELLNLWARGHSEPVPLPPRTAAREVETSRTGGNPREVASCWEYEFDPAWKLLGYEKYLSSLNQHPAQPRDGGGNRSAFNALAHRVWDPILDVEGEL